MPRWTDAWLIGFSIGFMTLAVLGVFFPDAIIRNHFLNDRALAGAVVFGGVVAVCDLLWRRFRKR
jgi:hypothetical protein